MSNDKNAPSRIKFLTKMYTQHTKTTIGFFVLLGLLSLLASSSLHSMDIAKENFFGRTLNGFCDIIAQAIGIGVLAGLLIQIFYQNQASEITNRIVRETLEEQLEEYSIRQDQVMQVMSSAFTEISSGVRGQREEIVEIIRNIKPLYYPTHVFVGTRDPDPEFNKKISSDLYKTNDYFFQGTGGAWTALRIQLCNREIARVRIVLPDPRPTSFNFGNRLEYECQLPRNEGKSIDTVRLEVQRHIAMALVGLFLARRNSAFHVYLSGEVFENRVELFKNAAYVCPYDRDKPNRKRYPETVRFEETSFSFSFLEYFANNLGELTHTIRIDRAMTQSGMEAELDMLGLLENGTRTFDDIRIDYQDFKTKYAKQAVGQA